MVWEESTSWTPVVMIKMVSYYFNGDVPVEGGALFFECGR
jgi:hypothetical protein